MKNSKIISLVALLATIIGLVGLIICFVPGQSKPDKTIAKYVSAISSGKPEKMSDCMYSLSDMAEQLLGSEYAGMIGSLEDAATGETSSGYTDELYGTLASSVFGVSDLPSDITKVKSVKVVGCVDGEETTEMGMTGLNVKVVLKIDYEDADGEKQTLYSVESVGLVKMKNKYYIVG